MLRTDPPDAGVATALATRLIVEPPGPVARTALPLADPERAAREAGAAGLPADVLARYGATVRQTHRRAHVVVLEVPAERQAALAAALAERGLAARPPLPLQPLLNDSVPLLAVPPLHDAGLRGAGIRIAIVDTGIDPQHPDLAPRIALRRDFSGAGDRDDVGHGTHVAGIAAGGGAVYRGVAPEATLLSVKALSAGGGTEDAVLAALSWASGQDVQVVNLSLGGPGAPDGPLGREVDALAAQGILVCVAAGNSGPAAGTIGSPGNARGALTVGAADKTPALAAYSSRGPVRGARYRKPDLIAIGGGVTPGAACSYGSGVASARAAVLADDPCVVPPRYVRMSGTSMATPHVSGICALLLEALASEGGTPVAKARRVRRALVSTTRPLAGSETGLVDAAAALRTIRGSAPRPPRPHDRAVAVPGRPGGDPG